MSMFSIKYRAEFLWPHNKDSIEEAGYEFANAITEEYRREWWKLLIERVRLNHLKEIRKELQPK